MNLIWIRKKVVLALVLALPTLGWAASVAPDSQLQGKKAGVWSLGKSMPIPVANPAGAVLRNGNVYIAGGLDSHGNSIADVQIYDPAKDKWSTGVALPTGLSGGVGALINDKVYIFGGTNAGTEFSSTTWMFDFTSGAWTQLASLPLAVRDSGIAVVDGVVYVIGGNAANNLRSPVVESYDPATDTWSLDNPSLQVGRSELSVGVLGSTIIAVDGYSTAAPTGDNETIASAGSQWTTQAPDPIPRSAACSAALGGSFYVAGGMAASHVTDHIHLYKGKKGMWNQPSAKMPVPVAWAVGVASKGMLYCFGGQTQFLQSNSTVGSVQIYKP